MAAGSGPEGKMIGKKNQCRSAQTRHLFKKPVRSKCGAHSPFPWLLLGSWFKRANERKVRPTSQPRWQWKKTVLSPSFNKCYWHLFLILNMICLFIHKVWFAKTATPTGWISRTRRHKSIQRALSQSNIVDGSISYISLRVEGGGGQVICPCW